MTQRRPDPPHLNQIPKLSQSKGIRVVLVEPEFHGNLGSVARAMGNMGFSELVLVNPMASRDHSEAQAMAVSASAILNQATVVPDLETAIANCQQVYGFTRRTGKQRQQFTLMKDFATDVWQRHQSQQKIALVFGTEQTGFTTEQADLCQQLVAIPTTKKFGSLNLAQAVMVVLYELTRSLGVEQEERHHRPASHAELEGLYRHLAKLMETIQYIDPNNPARVPRILRRVINRAEPNSQEVKIVRGVCRNIFNYLKYGEPIRKKGNK